MEESDLGELTVLEPHLQGEAERVLVVVEEAVQLSLLPDTLDTYGYQAGASQSGTAALRWIEAHGIDKPIQSRALLKKVREALEVSQPAIAGH